MHHKTGRKITRSEQIRATVECPTDHANCALRTPIFRHTRWRRFVFGLMDSDPAIWWKRLIRPSGDREQGPITSMCRSEMTVIRCLCTYRPRSYRIRCGIFGLFPFWRGERWAGSDLWQPRNDWIFVDTRKQPLVFRKYFRQKTCVFPALLTWRSKRMTREVIVSAGLAYLTFGVWQSFHASLCDT